MKIKLKKLNPEATIPTRATEHSNGYDLYALEKGYLYSQGGRSAIPTGIAIEIPIGYVGLVCPRSGLAIKKGIGIINAPGVIDADYRGEIMVLLVNQDDREGKVFHYSAGDKIGQLLVVKTEELEFEEVQELSDTQRGAGGLGSTGR